jgi:MYXO-CTERM domain-containing protein
MLRRFALLLPLVTACAPATPEGAAGEHVATAGQAFTSNLAVAVDIEFDGKLVSPENDVTRLRPLIQAQLMYAVGQLNGEHSNGRYEQLDLSAISAQAAGSGLYDVSYHARLPVAWGGGTVPSSYTLKLPARIGASDQADFATKYGATCVDPKEAGPPPVNPATMFLVYRPQPAGCTLDAADIVTLPATMTPSVASPAGKYPEYDRIWEDGALDIVAVFSRSRSGVVADDEGAVAHAQFMGRMHDLLRGLDPASTNVTSAAGDTTLAATLSDQRKITVHTKLIGSDLGDEIGFDAWYDARTPRADVVLYSGHAGLGSNIRDFATKGSFLPGKYMLWVLNGCDTFAYVDRTMATRRAALNPDDPSGTKYMDTVSNVMPSLFELSAATSMTVLQAVVAAHDPLIRPKSYRDMFASIDPGQLIVVTGEEDNVFAPKAAATASATAEANAVALPAPTRPTENGKMAPPSIEDRASGCGISAQPTSGGGIGFVALALAMLGVRRRRIAR